MPPPLLTPHDFGKGLTGETLAKFEQSDYLKPGEQGLCMLLSGIIAQNIHREMSKGRCNFYYIQAWLTVRLHPASYRKMITYSRENQGLGKGVTSFRCQERPVVNAINGCGQVLGVYFDLEKDAHACCILPDYCGTVALFFDPNYGLIRIRSREGVITLIDIERMLRALYPNDVGEDIKLRVGRYKERLKFYFGKGFKEDEGEEEEEGKEAVLG